MNHVQRRSTDGDSDGQTEETCATCGNPWPCEAKREEVTRAERLTDADLDALNEMVTIWAACGRRWGPSCMADVRALVEEVRSHRAARAEPVARAEVDEVIDLLDLLAPGCVTEILPELVPHARAIVARLARAAGVR